MRDDALAADEHGSVRDGTPGASSCFIIRGRSTRSEAASTTMKTVSCSREPEAEEGDERRGDGGQR